MGLYACPAHEGLIENIRISDGGILANDSEGRAVHQAGDVVADIQQNPAKSTDRLLTTAFVM